MKNLRYIIIIIALLAVGYVRAQREIAVYETLTLRVDVDPSLYTNPFDPDDIQVVGVFTSPMGTEIVLPAFWMQPFTDDCPTCAVPQYEAEGAAEWQLRFTPSIPGGWTYSVRVIDDGAEEEIETGAFEVVPGDKPGFVRAATHYFEFDDGTSFFPVGNNLKWVWDGNLRTYEDWLTRLSAAGGNYARLFIDVPWFIHLEWQGPAGDYRSAQREAAYLDRIIELAEEKNVYLQLVVLWHRSLQIYNGPPVVLPEDPPRPRTGEDWDDHPYNVVNGGPLSGPGVFFFDADARMLFERRLRYIAARWGYSPHVMAWELIDRAERVTAFNPENTAEWLQDMANYLRQVDVHGHLITASSQENVAAVVENPALDFISGQFYQSLPIEALVDQVVGVVGTVRGLRQLAPVPVMLVDYSLSPWFEPALEDPDGVHVRNSLWAAALAGAAGGAVSDWGETYVMPRDLYEAFAPLSAFAAGVEWSNQALEPAQAGLIAADLDTYAALRLTGFDRRFTAPVRDVVTRQITDDGVFPPLEDQPSYLYGQVFNNQFSQLQRYRVAVPVSTYLEIAVRAVSDTGDARLIVTINNQTAVEVGLRAGTRDTVVRVPLPAGEHDVVLDNLGEDWLELSYLEIGRMVAPARVLTLRDTENGVLLAWLQHRGFTWETADTPRRAVTFTYTLDNMPPGRYSAELWNPLTGAVVGEEIRLVGADGRFVFELLPLHSQLALRAFRLTDAPLDTPVPATETSPNTATSAPPEPTATLTPSPEPSATPRATNTPRPTRTPSLTPTDRVNILPRPTSTPRPLIIVQTNTPRPTREPTD